MHSSCPDFDLCQNCEAHPFPVHPDTHPMLKINNIHTVIPAVARTSPAVAAASTQTPVPVTTTVEEESAGTIRDLRRVYRSAAEEPIGPFANVKTAAPFVDSMILLEEARKNEQVMRNAYRSAVRDEPMAVSENTRSGGESYLDIQVVKGMVIGEDTRMTFRDLAAQDRMELFEEPRTETESLLDTHLTSHLVEVETAYAMEEDERSIRDTRRAYRAMAADEPYESTINAGDAFIRRVQEMEPRSATDELSGETVLFRHAMDSLAKARRAAPSTSAAGVNCETIMNAASGNSNARSGSTWAATQDLRSEYRDLLNATREAPAPMNVDDHREVRRPNRSLFSTDPADYAPEVARASQAVVEEMTELSRPFRDLFSQRRTANIGLSDNAAFCSYNRSFVDGPSSSEDTPAQLASPVLAIPSIPPLIPTAWSPPRWHVETPPSPVIVPTMLATEHTPPYEPRTVSPSYAVEDSVIEQTVVPPVILNEEFIASSPIASSRLTPASIARPLSPEHFPTDAGKSNADRILDDAVASTLGGLTTPSDVPESAPTPAPAPKLGPVQNAEWRELWPELTTMLKHLLQPPTPEASAASTTMPGTIHVEEEPKQDEQKEVSSSEKEFHTAVEESPLAKEALLTRPEGSSSAVAPRALSFNLRDYLTALAPTPSYVATYLSDNNIPDGQIFPPGAEFVKSWRMRNDGDVAWPEDTMLSFVAGDRIAHSDGLSSVKIGSVAPGAEVEVVSPEMKVCLDQRHVVCKMR